MKSATANRHITITLTSALILMLLASHMGGSTGFLHIAVAEPEWDTPHPPSIVNLTSPYLNEKGMVKAYHRDLIFLFNSWTNQTKSYLIKADTITLAEGNFTYHKVVPTVVETKIIRHLVVYIDGNISLERHNMVIYNKDYYDAPINVDGGSLLGYSWEYLNDKKWEIFRATAIGGVIGITILGYLLQYYYRKRMGEEIVVSSI